MSYNGISTREANLERLLRAVIESHCPNDKFFCGSCTEAREALDAKCGILVRRRGFHVVSAQHYDAIPDTPCRLPAGHSGQCNPDREEGN